MQQRWAFVHECRAHVQLTSAQNQNRLFMVPIPESQILQQTHLNVRVRIFCADLEPSKFKAPAK
eukprot:6191643-Pleurochrysis_carterae.AAC.1